MGTQKRNSKFLERVLSSHGPSTTLLLWKMAIIDFGGKVAVFTSHGIIVFYQQRQPIHTKQRCKEYDSKYGDDKVTF